MPLDPYFAQLVANAPPYPPLSEIPVDVLRTSLRASAAARPKLEIELADVQDRMIPGPAGPMGVRIYMPLGDGPFPVIVYFHGGGFVVGDLDTQDIIPRSLSAGVQGLVISVGYRLAPEHKFPAAPEDAWAALQWAAAHVQELGGDPLRIAVAGDSAGGVLACVTAIMARDAGGPTLAAQVNWYGPADHPLRDSESTREFGQGPGLRLSDVDYFWKLYLRDDAQYDDFRANPARASSHANLPPAFIATAECDPARDEAEAYGDQLRAAGGEAEIHRYMGMIHGFMTYIGAVEGARRSMKDACAFLRRHLGNPEV